MINLNALLRRRVEYYEYPWAIETHLRNAQSRFRSLFQASDVAFIFSKSMPRSGHRFVTECLTYYFGPDLHYCGFYRTAFPALTRMGTERPTAISCRRATISASAIQRSSKVSPVKRVRTQTCRRPAQRGKFGKDDKSRNGSE